MDPRFAEGRKPRHGCGRPVTLTLISAAVLASYDPTMLAAQESADQPAFIAPSTLKFESAPGAPSCFTVAKLQGDPDKGPSMLMQKLAAGCQVPWHWHSSNEYLLVMEGTLRLELKEAKAHLLHAGSYAFLPAHLIHRGGCRSACTVFAYRDGVRDIHYVDLAGKEIPLKEALGSEPATHPARKP